MAKIQAIRGTKDILPDEQLYWQFIDKKVADLLKYANYKEIKTPIFENSDLYDRGIGENTDIVNKEMYRFNDRSNRNITLRPEGTAGVARAFIENRMDIQNKLQKLWYNGPMFRYERPQSGRQRQFHQLGIEFIGSSDARADTEIIHLAMNIFKDLSINELQLDINSIGKAKDRNHYQAKLQEYLEQYYDDLDADSQNRLSSNPIRILDTKNKHTQKVLSDAPQISDFLSLESKKHFNCVCDYLTLLNIPYKINTQLVRGLDYYNDTAFEIKTLKSHGQDTVCGGGRYDNLIHQLGGNNTPAVGCAIGLERLLLIAKENILLHNMSIDCYVASQGTKAQEIGMIITQFLRNQLIKTELDISSSNFGKQIKQAHKKRAIVCLILGDNEVQQETITIKWMCTQEEENISIIQFRNKISYLKKKIAFSKKFNSY